MRQNPWPRIVERESQTRFDVRRVSLQAGYVFFAAYHAWYPWYLSMMKAYRMSSRIEYRVGEVYGMGCRVKSLTEGSLGSRFTPSRLAPVTLCPTPLSVEGVPRRKERQSARYGSTAPRADALSDQHGISWSERRGATPVFNSV